METLIKIAIIAGVIGIILLPNIAVPGDANYLTINKASSSWQGKVDEKTLSMQVTTGADIPVDGQSGAFGYALLSDNGNNIMVVVTHLPIDDSSFEQLPSGFHTHVLDLKQPTPACKDATFEVDLDNSAKNTAFDANYTWSVRSNSISVNNIPVSDLADSGAEAIVSFNLKPVLGADKKPTNLCVTVADNA
ncbi:MAG: hypothetical protein K0U68_01475 [Gammaproteobacteria bacterium]|nr:hypothetical protein [Gammaproteobacteria bacterium]